MPDLQRAPSLREIRQSVHELPRERRKDVVLAIREGRVVQDPRDAALAAAWAELLEARAERSPLFVRWLLPFKRPQGSWAWTHWVLHWVLLIAAFVYALVLIWHQIPGLWRWLLVGFLAYSVVTTPLTLRRMLQTYWNAPEAARKNRELAG